MQYNRVVQLANGTCIKIDNALSSKVQSIVFELEKGKKYEDHFSVFNEREQELDGVIYTDNNRVTLKKTTLSGKIFDVLFNIDTTNLEDGDEIVGTISITSNVGMLDVPYVYKVKASSVSRAISSFNTIYDYYDYLSENFDEARLLFTNSEFVKSPFMQDETIFSIYEGLLKGSNSNIALIEFFKVFEIDISNYFESFDDEIVKHYIDDTLDKIDLQSIKDNNRLVGALAQKNDSIFANEENVNEQGIDETEDIRLLENIHDKELLNVLASICVRNNFINRIAFEIYLKVVEKGSNINGIYDKFLLSIPEDYAYKLPLYIYRYYFDATNYSFDDKAKLYENIIATFEESESIYKMYSAEIVEYAISRIYQNRITDSLIKIYNKVLSINIINENNCNNVLYLLRSHKIIVKNRNIRKTIIRYKEVEKETKYDVINGIAYVPIFFDSYIMFYEDIYGNRYYAEDVEIKPLFNRKDIEKHIIENYPRKEIIDLTKLIKLNEIEALTRNYEVEEIKYLEAELKINSIIRVKLQNKIIDYYYNANLKIGQINDLEITYLKKIKFDRLNFDYKVKLLKVMLGLDEYKYVYDKVTTYGFNIIPDEDLLHLFSKCIDINDEDAKSQLLIDILTFVKLGHLDPKICNYLSNQYDGSIDNMMVIMRALNKLSMDSGFIAKKLLLNALECNDSRYIDEIYKSIGSNDFNEINLQVAYLNKKATDYFLDGINMDDEYFKELSLYMGEHYEEIDKDMPVIFLFAMTKYISTIKSLTNNEYRRLLIKSMERLLKTDYVFAYYKDINKHMRMPYSIMNKEYIEFHANKDFVPKAIVSISDTNEKKEIELTKMFMNIYVKKITVFKNEIITYEIINSQDLSSGIIAKGTLLYDENYEIEYPKSSKQRSTFDYINDAIVYLDRENFDGLKRTVIEMIEKQEISKELFSI